LIYASIFLSSVHLFIYPYLFFSPFLLLFIFHYPYIIFKFFLNSLDLRFVNSLLYVLFILFYLYQ
jgi:hypothetical protein